MAGDPHGAGGKTSDGWQGTVVAKERPKPPSYQDFLPNPRKFGLTVDKSSLGLTQTEDTSELEIEAKTTGATAGATAGAQTVRSASQKKNKDGLSMAGTNERALSGNKRTSTK